MGDTDFTTPEERWFLLANRILAQFRKLENNNFPSPTRIYMGLNEMMTFKESKHFARCQTPDGYKNGEYYFDGIRVYEVRAQNHLHVC